MLDRGVPPTSQPSCLPLGNNARIHGIGDWVCPRTSLDVYVRMQIYCPCQDWNILYPITILSHSFFQHDSIIEWSVSWVVFLVMLLRAHTLYSVQWWNTLELCETLKLHLRLCGSVSVCLGVLPSHLGALLPNSPLLGKCTPPSAILILPRPVDWNRKRIKSNTLLIEMFQSVPEILCRQQDAIHANTALLKVQKCPISMHQMW